MNVQPESLGLIAGSKALPLILARSARQAGVSRIVAAAFEGETDPALAQLVDEIVWLRVGQLGALVSVFKKRNISQCVMAGQIAPKNLFDVRLDMRAMAVLWRLKERNAHTMFGAIADELQKDGVNLIEATPWLLSIMPGAGYSHGPRLSAEQQSDVQFGFSMAKSVSQLEIGQVVVVKNGTVLAVEAFEGTDVCLKRGGELAGKKGGAVAVKVARLNHDMRFDIPCVGPQTIDTCAQSGISVLAVEASKTLLLEKEILEQQAVKQKISLVTVGPA